MEKVKNVEFKIEKLLLELGFEKILINKENILF